MLAELKPLATAIVALATTLIGTATPFIVMWLKNYFTVRANAAMNQTIAAAASREGALLLSAVPDIRNVKCGDPELVKLAQHMVAHYPEYSTALGMDLELAEYIILGEAHKMYNTNLVAVPAISASVVPKE